MKVNKRNGVVALTSRQRLIMYESVLSDYKRDLRRAEVGSDEFKAYRASVAQMTKAIADLKASIRKENETK